MRPALAPDANVRHRPLLLAQIEKYVHVHTQYKGLEVTPEGVLCQDPQGQRVLVPGDTVICALGQRSRTDVVEACRTVRLSSASSAMRPKYLPSPTPSIGVTGLPSISEPGQSSYQPNRVFPVSNC